MSENLKFYKGLEANLPTLGIEIGALYHCTDTGNTYRGVTSTEMELFGNTIGFTQLNDDNTIGGVVINQGVADGKASIASGTTDENIANDLVGSTVGSKFEIEAPEARGDVSISMGASTKAYSTGSRAYGVSSQAGYLGYYIWSVSGNTITLSTNQHTSLTFSRKKPNASILGQWTTGMTVSCVNEDYYPCFGKITAIDASNGTITVDTIPFTKLENGIAMAPHDTMLIAIPDVQIETILGQEVETTRQVAIGEVEFGFGAYADGFDNIAAGIVSTATGYRNTAIDTAAFVSGRDNIGGFATLVGGLRNEVTGKESTATGRDNVVKGTQASAQGNKLTALGNHSHIEGNSTYKALDFVSATDDVATIKTAWEANKFALAKGDNSHVEGGNCMALGGNSHAHGTNTIASGGASTAIGQLTEASGAQSYAEGFKSVAADAQAHAEGNLTQALAKRTHTEGYGTVATTENQHVQGRFNKLDENGKSGDYAHIVGGGSNNDNRKNIHTLDWNGNAWFAGSVSVGNEKLATESYVNEKIGNSDWTENDETSPAYIKNRTHWVEPGDRGELLLSKTINDSALIPNDEADNIISYDNLIVYLNGVEYNCEVIRSSRYHEAVGEYDTVRVVGESFNIHYDTITYTMSLESNSYPATFEIYAGLPVYHKLDKNYLPDDTVYSDDILKFNETVSTVESLSMQCKSTYVADKYINTFHGGSLTSVSDIMLPAASAVESGNHYITFHRKYNLAPIDYTKFDGRTVSHQNGALTAYWSEDGKIVLNGTATSTAALVLTGSVDTGPYTYLPAGTYRINGMQFGYFNIIDGAVVSTKKYVYAYKGATSNGASSTGADFSVPAEFTVTFNNPILVFRWALYVKSGVTFNNSAFVPYAYRVPEPDKDGKTYSVNVTSSGIELLDDIDGGQISMLTPEQFYSKLPVRITTIKNPELGTWDCSFSDDCEINPVDYVSITNKSTKEWYTGSVGHIITTFGDIPKKQTIFHGTNEPDNFLGEDGDIYIVIEA